MGGCTLKKPNTIVKEVVDSIGKQLRDAFESLRPIPYNPNIKGSEYEKALTGFLRDYLRSVVSIYKRCSLIDRNLELLTSLTPKKNEFDVVAIFNSACPQIILKKGEMKYIPLDAVAFLVEVAQTLTKPILNEDLDKMSNISGINTEERFRGIAFKSDYSVSYPIKVLAYYETQIDESEFFNVLREHTEDWDMAILIKTDTLYVNPKMPLVKKRWEKPDIEQFHPHALLWLIVWLSLSLTISPITNTSLTFANMWNVYYGHPLISDQQNP